MSNPGAPWSSGLVHRICVLMAESSECGFESWLRPRYVCPWARHITMIASLHPGVNGYLWGQSWLLCLISPIWAEMAAIELYTTPRELRWFQEWFMRLMSRGNNVQCLDLVARRNALYKNRVLLSRSYRVNSNYFSVIQIFTPTFYNGSFFQIE